MSEWFWSLLGWLCTACAAVQLIAGCWYLVALRRKWRPIPELWSMDWLDIVYRLEREFGVTLTAADFAGRSAVERSALTAGQVWELIQEKINAAGGEVPADGWERLKARLAEALSVKPRRIVPDSRLYADLGMRYGIE